MNNDKTPIYISVGNPLQLVFPALCQIVMICQKSFISSSLVETWGKRRDMRGMFKVNRHKWCIAPFSVLDTIPFSVVF